ncbi:MAG TPA: ABC transporter substrate-binding protein [Bacillota bacterium]|nr:ABC transporter substrate-binding protein [Bacillota bacterium]HOL09547.1 ABC transporter substrate-binding protein [Bacillota bacterium]HPO97482.1 ABC transporter substrate-binding protein [Bacillota bacterium]
MIRKVIRSLVVVLLLAVTMLSVADGKAGSKNPQKLVTIRLANLAVGISSMPQQMALEKGIFKKHGIDLKVINFIKGGAEATAGVASGQVDMGSYGSPIITGIAKGLPIKIVASPPNKRIEFVLVATNAIKKVTDLKGKTVATGALGGGNHQSFLKILAGHGMSEKDVKIVATGGTDAYMILTSGKVAAVETNLEVAIRAELEGTGHLLAESAKYYQNYQHSFVFATIKLIETNPQAIHNFLKASREAYQYAKTHQEELIAYTVKKLNMDERVVREYWKKTIPKWDLSFKIDVPGTEGALKTLQELKEIDPNVVFDQNRFIDLRFTK